MMFMCGVLWATPAAVAQEETDLLAKMEEAEATMQGEPLRQRAVQVALRGGYANYYQFNFVTGGIEAGVRLVKQLHVVAGVEMYAVRRLLPLTVNFETGQLSEWNLIWPINAGAIYKFPLANGVLEPYIGADAILVNYFAGSWAVGGRARGGLDIMVNRHFGINVNVAVGGWSGNRWVDLDVALENAGLLPQVSGGVVASF